MWVKSRVIADIIRAKFHNLYTQITGIYFVKPGWFLPVPYQSCPSPYVTLPRA